MADAGLTFLLENVEHLLKYDAQLVRGAEDEFEQLHNDLSILKAFLHEATQRLKEDETLRNMERQIREIVYDAEDTIDDCLTRAAAVKSKRRLSPFLNPMRFLAKEIKGLREDKLKPVLENVAGMDSAKLQTGDGSGTSVGQPREKEEIQSIRKDNIVGLEDEEETLVNYLMRETEQLDVISIIGMPGLGKTTLAWKIYQNPKIKYKFSTRIWVHVSQQFNIRDLLLNILKEFTGQDMSSLSDDELVLTVRAHLAKGKFLLVMDDVWTVEAWNKIQQALPKSNWNGKVLITSRDRTVGYHANVTRKPHMLRFQTQEESWMLLQLEVFGELNKCPQELEHKGELIASQCGGLPLAIVVIGLILRCKLSKTPAMGEILDAWGDVANNVSTYLRDDNKHNNISNILVSRYDNLPHDLRHCFLYLGVFPEDYEIPVWTVTRLWIAEGFIQHKEGKNLEKIAEENLEDLIDMNLVMVGKTNPNGKLKTCRVHNMMRDFCISKAAFEEQNLFHEIKQSKEGVWEPPVSDLHKYRRICIHSELRDFLRQLLSRKVKGHRIRSLLCFNREPVVLDIKYSPIIPYVFDLLRVLDCNSFKFMRFPIRFTRLTHLRYLTLSFDTEIDVLPKAVSELWNLQTLVVDTRSHRLAIEANIWKLIELRHIKTKAEIILAIDSYAGNAGEKLQTLSRLSPECCTAGVFKRAHNLKKLGVRGRLANLFQARSLEKLDHLENLKLFNDLHNESASEDPLRELPPPSCFPQNIKSLTLSATYLEWNHMSTLGMIDTLQVLKLKNHAFTGESWHVDGGFYSLQFLLIDSTNLVNWQTSDDDFPTLNCLVLKNCENLKEIPLGVTQSLQVLEIEHVPKSVVESAMEIEKRKEMERWLEIDGFKLSIGAGCERSPPDQATFPGT